MKKTYLIHLYVPSISTYLNLYFFPSDCKHSYKLLESNQIKNQKIFSQTYKHKFTQLTYYTTSITYTDIGYWVGHHPKPTLRRANWLDRPYLMQECSFNCLLCRFQRYTISQQEKSIMYFTSNWIHGTYPQFLPAVCHVRHKIPERSASLHVENFLDRTKCSPLGKLNAALTPWVFRSFSKFLSEPNSAIWFWNALIKLIELFCRYVDKMSEALKIGCQ